MRKGLILGFVVLALIIAGCASTLEAPQLIATTVSTPEIQNVTGDGYEIQLEPLKQGHPFFVAFELTINNRSTEPIFIDWNLTRYNFNGRPAGSLVWRGINAKAIKKQRIALEAIAPGGIFSREIAPHKLVAWQPLRSDSVSPGESGLSAGQLPAGENGVRLVFRKGGELLKETLSVFLTQQ